MDKQETELDDIQNELTRTGPIRQGLDYQDACAAYLFVNWLRQPDIYQWVKLEADEFGFLDDIVVVDKDNNLILKQVKFSCHPDCPDDEWTWESLLKESKGKKGVKASLFKKWFLSWMQEFKNKSYYNVFPELITNRKAGQDIINSTNFCKNSSGRRVNFARFKKQYKKYYEETLRQIHPASENDLKSFLNNFTFLFNQHDLEATWNNSARVFSEFGALQDDWLDFKEKIRAWATVRTEPSSTGKITIEDLRIAAGWIKLRSFNENFSMPKDFVLFDSRISQNIISNVKKPSGGVQILWGSPGAGKSTYLSYLHDKLKELKLDVLKHHYYIGLNDPDFSERLKCERTKEALKSSIYNRFNAQLGSCGNKNPKIASLREYLESLSKYLTAHKKTLILIIDGLDHVTTYGEKIELKEFLEELSPCPKNIWILLGTRLLEETVFPPHMLSLCPKEKWIEIKPFTKMSVQEIININIKQKKLRLPDNEHLKKDFSEKFFQITQGHPLHIRYTLEKLADLSTKSVLTARDVENLPPYGGDIGNYYAMLWRSLPSEGKTIVILLATADFALTREQILDILNLPPATMQLLLDGFEQIKHLIKNTIKGYVFFHASFKAYILSTAEYTSSKKVVKTYLKDWIEKKAPENIRWENLLILEYELDNDKPLLSSLSKDWAIQAIKNIRSISKIDEQLSLGIDAAIKKDDFANALSFGLLSNSIDNALSDNHDAYEKLFLLLLQLKKGDELGLFINEDSILGMSSKRLDTILNVAHRNGREDIIDTIFEELNHHIDRDDDRTQNKFLPRENALHKAVAYINIAPKKVLKRIASYRDTEHRTMLLSSYCQGLLESEQLTTIESLLREKISENEKQNILEAYSYYCLRNKIDCSNLILRQRPSIREEKAWLLLMLTNKLPHKLPFSLPLYSAFPDKLEDHKINERTEIERKFYKCYISALFLGFSNNSSIVEKWISECTLDSWGIKACMSIANLGKIHGENLKNNKDLNYDLLIIEANKLKELKWSENRDTFQIFIAFRDSLEKVFNLMKIVNSWLKGTHKIEERTIKTYCDSAFFGKEKLFKNLAYEKMPFMENDICIKFIEAEEAEAKKHISCFSERAEWYVDLTYLALLHGESKVADRLAEKAILNMLGYGYHKDMYHADVLDCISSCMKAGSKKCDSWLARMSPLIAEVRSYTDSDETRYLQEYLAGAYVLVNSQRLKNYYLYNADKENVFLAEDIFPYVIESSCIDNPFDKALLKTGVDKKSILKLTNLAKEKNTVAESVLNEQKQYFLSLETFPKDREDSERYSAPVSEKTAVDYELISPSQLISALNKHENMYDKGKFISSWCEHWFAKPDKKEEAYKAVWQWVESVGIEEVEHSVLDILYPLAATFEGKEKGYYILYHAHLRGYGWSGRFFSRKEDILERWKYLKDNYPKKSLDFIKDTLKGVDRRGRKRFTGFLPIPRGVEFLTYFNYLKETEDMTEVAIKFAESLMADLELPKPPWVDAKLADSLDVLFSRLLWPSPVVRERAASALSMLISDESISEEVFERYSDWASMHNLESISTLVLLPIAKSVERDGKTSKLKYDLIKTIINRPSINSEYILKDIAKSLDSQLVKTEHFDEVKEPLNLLACPKEHKPSTFFLRFIKGFLPPIHYDRAKRIESNSGFEFVKQWSWDAGRIQKELNIGEEAGDMMDFLGGHYRPLMLGMSSKLSEIYRSAYLRTLFFCYKLGNISKELLLEWTFDLCPIDLSLWGIGFQYPPKWWPCLLKKSDAKIDVSKSEIWKSAEEIILSLEKQNKIIALDGPAQPFEGWFKNNLGTSITLIPFAYKVKGPKLPKPTEVEEEILYSPIYCLYPTAVRPFHFFDSHNKHYSTTKTGGIILDDLSVFPLVCRLDTLSSNFWQVCKRYHAPFGLSENLMSLKLDMHDRKDSWVYLDKDVEIAKGFTWNQGIIERNEKGFDMPAGQVIEIDGDWLKKILENQKTKLGYAIKIQVTFKEYSYEKPKFYEETRLFNISPIIS